MAPARRLFLVDGSSQMYRAYHAIRGLTGPDGQSTNAIYGFVTMLRKLIDDHRPEFIAAAFDLPAPTFRSELAADYKANRAPMPADLAEQIPLVHDACEALGVPVFTHERYEADDVIGTLARLAAADGLDVALVTGDKDFFQLVTERVHVFNPRDEGTWYDADGVRERFGVAPGQVVDVLALMGDAIDNVKGVPGIGEKGARELITAHGSLDALLAGVETVPQKKYREALLAHAEDARRSRELVRIHTDVPVAWDPEAFRYRGPQRARCYELFTRLGFRSLTTAFAPTAESVERDYAAVTTAGELDGMVTELRAAGAFACALVGDGESAVRCVPVALAFSTKPRHARVVVLSGAAEASAAGGQAPQAKGADPDGGGTGDLFAGIVAEPARHDAGVHRTRVGVDGAAVRRPGTAQDRARPEDPGGPPRGARRGAPGRRGRHAAGQLPRGLQPRQPRARGPRPRAGRLSDEDAGNRSAARA